MSDEVLVKLVVDEPEVDMQVFEFEQETIKIGRGRPGKARKGVDVQLTDASVARVAAVLHVRSAEDVFIMDMGSGVTRIADKKVGARGKVTNGTEVLVGNTRITVYIGEAADAFSPDAAEEAFEVDDDMIEGSDSLAVSANISFDSLDGAGGLPDDDLPTSFESGGGDWGYDEGASTPPSAFDAAAHADAGVQAAHNFGAAPATPAEPASSFGAPTPVPASGPAAFADAPPPAAGSFGIPPDSETPGIPQGYQFLPMHQTPMGVTGPVGPTPMPLPEHFSGPNLSLLLDVSDRLGKEVWYTQPVFW
jgi:hypothetical protein